MSTIKIKRSGVSAQTPSTLEHGELALNYADGKLFYKDATNAIAELSTGGGTGGGLDSAAIGGVEFLPYKMRLITNEDRFSIGQNANVDNNGEGNIAIGFNASANGGQGAISLGKQSSAGGYQSLALGTEASANTDYSISVGVRAGANGGTKSGILIGYQCGLYMSNSPSEEGNVFIGRGAGSHSSLNQAANFFNRTVAIGEGAAIQTTGQTADAIAIGYSAGQVNMGSNSINIGRNAGKNDAGDNSITVNATGLEVSRTDQYAIDIRTSDSGSVTYSTDSDWVFGAPVTSSEFKFTDGTSMTTAPTGGAGGGLDSAGVISTINEELKIDTNQVEIGSGASVTNSAAIAIGKNALSRWAYSIAIGEGAEASYNSKSADIALGFNAEAVGGESIALGRDTIANQINSIAIGNDAQAQGTSSVAIGPNAKASLFSSYSIVIGENTTANDDKMILMNASGSISTVSGTHGIDIRTSDSGSLTYNTTDDWKFGAQVSAPELTVDAATSDWKFSVSGDDLIISFGGTSKAKLDTAGNLTVVGDVTAFGTI